MTAKPKIQQLWTSPAVERLFDTSDLGFFIVSTSGTILDANDTFCKVIGYSRPRLMEMSVYDITYPDDLAMTLSVFAHTDTDTSTHFHEKRYVTSSGDPLWVKLRTAAVKNDDNSIKYRIVMVENIHAEKQNELYLRQMAAIVEQSEDAIFRTNSDGIIQFWSKGAELLYGYKAEEVLGTPPSFLVRGLNEATNTEVPERLRRGEMVIDPAGVARHKDGHTINVSVHLFPLADAEDNTVAFVGVHRDIRELKQLEEQLRHSQRMETAGLLAGGIAHDFNNILTVIQGSCGALEREIPRTSPLLRYLELIDRSSDKASRLTRQLLAFSRKQPITPQILDPSTLLKEFSPMLMRTLGDNIQLVTHFDSRQTILEDPTQLEQVILNLCINARYAMAKGGRIELRIEDVACVDERILLRPGYDSYRPLPIEAGRYVMVSVSDSGSGIDPQIISHIFEPFYTTKPKGEGTGLGLAVVYGVVSQSGGAINVLTRPGHGSTFQIFFPSVSGTAQQQAEQQQMTGPGKGRILIIEDDEDVRALIADMLRSAGYKVTEAASPRDVLMNLVDADVDLILSDVIMPEMSGPEFAQLWLERHPHARFLFMSGYFDEERYPAQLGAENLLLKPFKPSELVGMIEQKLSGGRP